MKINKCKTSSSRGLSDQPLALGRVFVVVVAVVLVVAFLTGRSVSCDEAGAVRSETDSSEAGSFPLGEVSDKLAPFSCWLSICPPPQTLGGSFSAVSKPKFTSKFSSESSRRELHNALPCTVL